jgi:hypothetical protein
MIVSSHGRYDYTPIRGRAVYDWPNGTRISWGSHTVYVIFARLWPRLPDNEKRSGLLIRGPSLVI